MVVAGITIGYLTEPEGDGPLLAKARGTGMPSARDIADERLARGEIGLDEHRAIVESLSAESDEDAQGDAIAPPPVPEAPARKKRSWVPYAIGAGLVFIVISFLADIKSGRTEILNLKSSGFFGDEISGKLITEGDSGTVYLWVEQGEKMMCPKVTFVQKNVPQGFTFKCSSMDAKLGTFRVITNRQPPDWVKQNALSL